MVRRVVFGTVYVGSSFPSYHDLRYGTNIVASRYIGMNFAIEDAVGIKAYCELWRE